MTRRKFGSIEKHTNAGSIYWHTSRDGLVNHN